jgi:outer membrane protein TolC
VAAARAARDKNADTEVQVRQATAALALARTRYQAGVVTNLDVLDAETVLAQAKLVQLRARYDLVRSRYQLQQAVGERVW